MNIRTNYPTWIKNRWVNAFLLGHLKQIKESVINLIISIFALTLVAFPYLIVEGLLRLFLKMIGKYNVVNK